MKFIIIIYTTNKLTVVEMEDIRGVRLRKFKLRKNCIRGKDAFSSQIQMSAILEFYVRFRYRPVRRNLHVFLHQAAKFRPNRSTHCGNITSYPFLKMAAATAKYYFRFPIS